MSWFPDPKASIIDTFSIGWSNGNFYEFPPFSFISTKLAKSETSKWDHDFVMVAKPIWFPLMLQMLQDFPT